MSDKKTRKPWVGRFKADLDLTVQKYTRSLHLDRRLASYDIQGSRAHVRMLAARGIISEQDEESILKGLHQIEQEIESDDFPFREELEDIHMNIEYRLQEIIGEAGGRIHTGRSRNDQVALDLKMFCLDTAMTWRSQILELQGALLDRAQELKRDLFPGWTHLQAAQPISWGHYLLAFCEMLERDDRRLASYRQLHSCSPLGAGALAGSTLPLEPERTAQELGFSSSFNNSYDVVGDRDFILELLQIASQVMIHLSRFAEDFIYLSSTPVSWIELPDFLCTGSSMMPQKKNPDLLELTRGKTASVLGHASALASLLKGLPSSYHRDLQQDKEHLFTAVDTVEDTLNIVPLVVSNFKINKGRVDTALREGFLMATDLAEYLVNRGVPFREAHRRVGKLIAYCLEEELVLDQVPLEKLQEFAPECGPEVSEVMKFESFLKRRSHKGSPGMIAIEERIAEWNKKIKDLA
ncbi:MAG: argininosuccinate lyase [Acidobacteriota bacterium]